MTEASAESNRPYIKLNKSSATLRGHEPGKSRSFLFVSLRDKLLLLYMSHKQYLISTRGRERVYNNVFPLLKSETKAIKPPRFVKTQRSNSEKIVVF